MSLGSNCFDQIRDVFPGATVGETGDEMKRRVGFLLFLIACAASAQTQGRMELANAPVPAGARRIAYGTDPLQFGELRLPAKNGPQRYGPKTEIMPPSGSSNSAFQRVAVVSLRCRLSRPLFPTV